MITDNHEADPVELASQLAADPRAAMRRTAAKPDLAARAPLEQRLAWVMQFPPGADRVGMMREMLAEQGIRTQQRLSLRFPTQVGNCFNGAPFDLCALANRVVATAMASETHGTERAFYLGLLEPREPATGRDTEVPRTIVYLNPLERAGLIEVHGNPRTARNAGIFMPGARTDHNSLDERTGIAQAFVDARPEGDLSMVTCAMDSFPGRAEASQREMYLAAIDPRPARRIANRLAAFADLLRAETDATIPLIGHSLGGLIAGLAAADALDVDILTLVNAAGSGLRDNDARGYVRPDRTPIPTFVLDNPADYIIGLRPLTPHFGPGVGQLKNVTHLRAPEYLPGYPGGRLGPMEKYDGHTDALRPHTTSFDDLLGVLTGGPFHTRSPGPGRLDRVQRALDGISVVARRAATGHDKPPRRLVSPSQARTRRGRG